MRLGAICLLSSIDCYRERPIPTSLASANTAINVKLSTNVMIAQKSPALC